MGAWTIGRSISTVVATAGLCRGEVRERIPDLMCRCTPMAAFVFGSRDLWDEVRRPRKLTGADAQARSAFDLVITSVLLDAGAGAEWRYHDRATGLVVARSEDSRSASLRGLTR